MKAVILGAGKSTRTYPLTLTRPKLLLTVMNKTLLEHNLEALEGLVDEVIVVVGYKKEMLIERFSDYKGFKLRFVEQKEQLGTGDALRCAREFLSGKFLVMNGDDIYGREDIKACIKEKHAILAQESSQPERFGVVEQSSDNLVRIVEKPADPKSKLINTGLYVLSDKIFDFELKETERGELELVDYANGLARKEQVKVKQVCSHWLPVGYPWHIIEANKALLQKMEPKVEGVIEDGAILKGAVRIGKGTLVKSGTYIEGPVLIGEDSMIGPSAYIRPDTTIGNRCKIRAEVFDAVIMDDSVAKHYSYVAHSVLGEDVNIGAGTITADYRHDGKNNITIVKGQKIDSGRRKLGSFMGDHVRTGINTSIYPGRKIWPGCGTLPGSVVKKDIMVEESGR